MPSLVTFCAAKAAVITAILMIAIGAASPVSAQTFATDIPLDGGSERVLFSAPANARAALIMLPGGDGIVDIGVNGASGRLAGNFLVRTLPLWTAQGFAVAILGSPNNQSLLGQRRAPAYAAAIDRAVDFVRSRTNVPVWLVGTSQGSIAAANGAGSLGGKVAGVVLSSSVTRSSQSGETVFDASPETIAIPALVVANQGDACGASPPADASTIAAHLTRSPRKEVIFVQSSEARSDSCQAMSPHGYYGIEPIVVQRIAQWIR